MKKHDVNLNFETAAFDKNQITVFLLNVAKKRNLINREKKKFISNSYFNSIYTKEALMSIMNETISKVVNAHEAYIIKEQEKKSLGQKNKATLTNIVIKNKNKILNKAFDWIDVDDEEDTSDEDNNVKKIKKTDLLKKIESLLNPSDLIAEVFPNEVEDYKAKILKAINKTNLMKLKKDDLMDICIQFHIPNYAPSISDNLDLSTLGNVTGYFLNAYSNNISKDYKKYTANKREGELVSYDLDSDHSTDDQKETVMVFNQISEDNIETLIEEAEFKQCFYKILKALKKYDKKFNEINRHKYTGDIPENKKSFLAYLFLYLIDPRYKGKYVYIKEKMDISQYIFNSKKEEIVNFIKKYFPEEAKFIYNYVNEYYKTYGGYLRPKKTENYYDQSCSVNDSFEIKFINKRLVNIIYKISVVRLNNGRWETLETKEFIKKTITGKIEESKQELKIKHQDTLSKLKAKAEGKRLKAIKDIYVAS